MLTIDDTWLRYEKGFYAMQILADGEASKMPDFVKVLYYKGALFCVTVVLHNIKAFNNGKDICAYMQMLREEMMRLAIHDFDVNKIDYSELNYNGLPTALDIWNNYENRNNRIDNTVIEKFKSRLTQ